MSLRPHCTHCNILPQHREKAARRKRKLEEGTALEEKLTNEAQRRCLDFDREQRRLKENLEEDIEQL